MTSPRRYRRRWKCHKSFVCCYKVDKSSCQSPWETHRYGRYYHDMSEQAMDGAEVCELDIPWWDVFVLVLYTVTHDPKLFANEIGLWVNGLLDDFDAWMLEKERAKLQKEREKEREQVSTGVTEYVYENEYTHYATRANFLADPKRKCICGLAHKPGHCDGGR